jgi:hypothetical protein
MKTHTKIAPNPLLIREIDASYKKLEELKTRMSKLRKIGKDPLLAEAMTRNIHTKIQYAEVTRNEDDINRVKKMLEEAEKEIEEIEAETAHTEGEAAKT